MSFDVYCKCTDGSRVIVEMQNYAKKTFVDRAMVYTAASILENYTYSRGKDYHVQKTYFIAITGEKVFPQVNHAPVRLALCDFDAEKTTQLNDKILHIFIELPKFADSLDDLNSNSPFLSKFAVAMKTMPSCDERPSVMDDDMLIKMFAAADIKGYKKTDLEKYKQSVMNQFEYEETLKEYRQEALVEGRQEGRYEIATKMLQDGVAKDTIAKYTGLDEKEISSLKTSQ